MIVTLGAMLTLFVATPAAQAADLTQFRPGAIISDEVFYNSGTMDATAVQRFLDSRVATCSSGYTCLKDYRQDTWSRSADPMCGAYQGAASESAAAIIVKVARACGINPQVLIVLLQKEQSLVTSTRPTSGQYRSATGYGCPDTAPCDAQYYGFYNQVYKAAWAFKRYNNPAGTGPGTAWSTVYTRYAPGKSVDVYYHPSTSCGSSKVFIENKATAALYFYTPYQPNRAALNAGYQTGDSCSAYGNRNFYNYMIDWFGAIPSVGSAFADYYNASGGTNGPYGRPTTPQLTLSFGKVQTFGGGVMYATGRGVLGVRGWIEDVYAASGSEKSPIGLPTADEKPLRGGAWQEFERGRIYASASGAFITRGWIGDEYIRLGGSTSALGFPVGNEYGVSAGAVQQFQFGALVATATGTYSVRGWIGDKYRALGAEKDLGLPLGNEYAKSGVVIQDFQKGSIVCCTPNAYVMRGEIDKAWDAAGGPASVVGVPRDDQKSAPPSGNYQQFANGRIVQSNAGAFVVRGWIGDAYNSVGGWTSAFGYPRSNEQAAASSASQQFTGGIFYSTSAGAYGVRGWIGDKYATTGALTSPLGAPTSFERSLSGGAVQTFRAGRIYSSSAGAFVVRGSIGDKYNSAGAESSPLRYPRGDEKQVTARNGTVGYLQQFQGGRVYVSPAGFAITRGWLGDHYVSLGAEASGLGFPRGDEYSRNGVFIQEFQNGRIELRGSTFTVVRY
ncbi:LGFP repeat-containing protein [Desertivibrio insolitus]|uniref:LGFP repeat-containing protein n=1 Tax=Herbiconiux sp. SYSU D00978 TaxID=2812562 RepID=UPI001A95E9AF|nr:hypothetical protein [Herbiconiux sp. SYSU D00978]